MPAECFPPGDFIREELEARGWSEERLRQMVGWSHEAASLILAGDREITEDDARRLAEGFGTSQRFWLNLETAYRRWLRCRP